MSALRRDAQPAFQKIASLLQRVRDKFGEGMHARYGADHHQGALIPVSRPATTKKAAQAAAFSDLVA
jgi:hypothetical protein